MQIHRTGTFGRWYRTEVAIILPSLGRGASALGRCRVRDRPHGRTTRISHVVTDSTRRTSIEYSIQINEEALGKVVEWYADGLPLDGTQMGFGRQVIGVVGRPETLHVGPRSRGGSSKIPAVVRSCCGPLGPSHLYE